MTDLPTAHLVELYESLKSGKTKKQWESAWEDEDYFQAVHDNLDDLIYFATVARPLSNTADMEQLIGKLTIAKIMLDVIKEGGANKAQFLTVAQSLDATIRNLLFTSPVVQTALEKMKKAEFLEDILGENPQPELANQLFMVLSAIMLISNEVVEEDMCCEEDDECGAECN